MEINKILKYVPYKEGSIIPFIHNSILFRSVNPDSDSIMGSCDLETSLKETYSHFMKMGGLPSTYLLNKNLDLDSLFFSDKVHNLLGEVKDKKSKKISRILTLRIFDSKVSPTFNYLKKLEFDFGYSEDKIVELEFIDNHDFASGTRNFLSLLKGTFKCVGKKYVITAIIKDELELLSALGGQYLTTLEKFQRKKTHIFGYDLINSKNLLQVQGAEEKLIGKILYEKK